MIAYLVSSGRIIFLPLILLLQLGLRLRGGSTPPVQAPRLESSPVQTEVRQLTRAALFSPYHWRLGVPVETEIMFYGEGPRGIGPSGLMAEHLGRTTISVHGNEMCIVGA